MNLKSKRIIKIIRSQLKANFMSIFISFFQSPTGKIQRPNHPEFSVAGNYSKRANFIIIPNSSIIIAILRFMNRRAKHTKPHQNIIAGEIQMLDHDYSWTALTMNQRKKCKQKFDIYKPCGSDKLSKYELQRLFREMGKQLSEEEIVERIWEIDPKGQGFISFQSFVNKMESQKQKKFEEITNFIGLTFDSVLEKQRQKTGDFTCEEITWTFLREYLSENFEIEINVNSLVGKKSSAKSLNRNEFMSIFS